MDALSGAENETCNLNNTRFLRLNEYVAHDRSFTKKLHLLKIKGNRYMKAKHIHVLNYKGLNDTSAPLSDFVCVIGENNAGKSSLLQALLLFVKGTKLTKTEYYDPNKDIVITVTLTGITEELLNLIAEEHRTKITPYVHNGELVLARRYSIDGSSQLRVVTDIPKEKKFHQEQVDEALKGKKNKEIVEVMTTFYPEVADTTSLSGLSTQKAAKDLISIYIAGLSTDKLMITDIPLPTGIDNSLRILLPEPIYIPAVKDLSDELKTKESASFGKLLNILLDVIEDDLADAVETFENLRKKLNRVTQPDGTVVDDRMEKVREIEATIQANLQETFRNVSIELEIPPPEIKTVLSGASIVADDGVRGPIDNKGDGFKRAIAFSILRSYVQLSQSRDWRHASEREKPGKDRFLFLFEEPELYLHPRAQNILFDALALIAKRHQVAVTTHSPFFFSADETTTFIKIAKKQQPALPRPMGVCHHVDLTDVGEKDKFQLISFETANLAFFSNKIVLVEGDSELIVLPHIAKLLDTSWDFKTSSTNLVKIGGKGSFKRYKDFFKRFDVAVVLVADLDILIREFDKVEATPEAAKMHTDLLQAVDNAIDDASKLATVPIRLLKEELQRNKSKRLLEEIQTARASGDIARQTFSIEEFFSFERTEPRLEVLKDHSRADIVALKRLLLAELRKQGVFILERGSVEAYYPEGVMGSDKPSRAQHFCTQVHNSDEVRRLCDNKDAGAGPKSEFDVIMGSIFCG